MCSNNNKLLKHVIDNRDDITLKSGRMSKVNLGGSIKNKVVNPDLEEERAKLAFDRQEMASFVYTEDIHEPATEFGKDIVKYPELKTDFSWFEMNREEKMEYWLKKVNRLSEIDREKYISGQKISLIPSM